MNDIFFKSLRTIDTYADYIPVVSTVTNLVDIFLKTVYIPSLDDEVIANNHYYTYLNDKSIYLSILLLIPFVGNICIILMDTIPYLRALNIIHYHTSEDMHLEEFHLLKLPPKLWKRPVIRRLFLDRNFLWTLPAGIGQLINLRELSLSNNCLTTLPSEIGGLRNLENLDIDSNNLRFLPPEIGNLTNLKTLSIVNNRRLRELPLSLGQIPTLTEIHTYATGIDAEIVNTILRQCRLMRSDADKILPVRLQKWHAIARSSGDLNIDHLTLAQKNTLNEWLFRLENTQDFAHHQSSLASIVCDMLADVLRNREFGELAFTQAEANNECCQDRAAMSLNEIYTSWKLLCCREEVPPLKLLVGVAKTLRLRKELQKLIGKEEKESVEIFLYYETLLRERLHLVTAIKKMAYGTIGKRSWINQTQLIKAVEENFVEELIELPLFAKRMKAEWDPIIEEHLEKLGNCPEGGEFDPKVLSFKVRQGEIMQELKMKKISTAWAHLLE